MRPLAPAVVFLSLAALTCGRLPTLSPEQDIATVIAQTLTAHAQEEVVTQAAQTLAAAMTQLAAFSQTPPPVVEAGTPMPTNTPLPAVPSATPAEFAPDPLPAAYTGVALHVGECFNLDAGQVVASPDSQCDLWLVEAILIRQQNNARVSGYVTLQPPSRSYCQGARYELGDLAIQTNMYYCFITNEGQVGFFVPRGYLDTNGFVFDYWIFP